MNDYGEKTRARIKDALEALVEEGGNKKPTVSDVLSRSGVARSTFYVYYENFQDLLEELAADTGTRTGCSSTSWRSTETPMPCC